MKDANQKNEVNTKLEKWYKSYIVDNIDENNEIARLCLRQAVSMFDIDLEDEATVLAIYNFVFEAIVDELKKMQEKTSEIEIRIGKIVSFGYDNLVDDDSEKPGNFCPFIYDLGERLDITKSLDESSVEACTKWMTSTMKEYPKMWDSIATTAVKNLEKEVKIPISQSVIVLPLFAMIQSELCMYMDIRRKDLDESSTMITFASVVDVYAIKTENNTTEIQFKPKPSMKLGTKSDRLATAPEEDAD